MAVHVTVDRAKQWRLYQVLVLTPWERSSTCCSPPASLPGVPYTGGWLGFYDGHSPPSASTSSPPLLYQHPIPLPSHSPNVPPPPPSPQYTHFVLKIPESVWRRLQTTAYSSTILSLTHLPLTLHVSLPGAPSPCHHCPPRLPMPPTPWRCSSTLLRAAGMPVDQWEHFCLFQKIALAAVARGLREAIHCSFYKFYFLLNKRITYPSICMYI